MQLYQKLLRFALMAYAAGLLTVRRRLCVGIAAAWLHPPAYSQRATRPTSTLSSPFPTKRTKVRFFSQRDDNDTIGAAVQERTPEEQDRINAEREARK